jgi:DNA-binding MarR family transcriptional regulator
MQLNRSEDPAAVIERELTLLVRRAQKVSLRGREPGHPVDRAAYAILGRLLDAGAQRPGALAEHFYLDASTISRQVASLEKEHLVERVADRQDGRASLLQLTRQGEMVLVETRAERRQVVEGLVEAWSLRDREAFARLLGRLNVGLDEQFHGQLLKDQRDGDLQFEVSLGRGEGARKTRQLSKRSAL